MSSAEVLSRRRSRAGSALGVGLSVIAHLVFFAAILFGAQKPGFYEESSPIADVELIPAWPSSAHRKPQAVKATPRHEPEKTETTVRPKQALSTPVGRDGSIKPPALQPEGTSPQNGAFHPALGLGLGCAHADFMRLTSEERAACNHRFASRAAADRDYAEAGIDPEARAAFDAATERENVLQTPFLSAMPKKGCRPRVTEHDAAAFGKSQPDFTVQATCVVHF
jgi:hypothetical protein